MKDFTIENQGTLVLFTMHTDEAKQWWKRNVDSNCMQWGNSYVVEHRYAQAIIDGLYSGVDL
tara:strand:+ start:197 stop:382 length:186 start_codon:yes stop_codon:yes gene_type:complete